jgi:hypothetical protein
LEESAFPERWRGVIRDGIHVPLRAPPRFSAQRNSATTRDHVAVVSDELRRLEAMGVIRRVPMEVVLVSNPIAVIVRGDKVRIIVDHRRSGLNDWFDSPAYSMPSVRHLLATVRTDGDPVLWMIDVKTPISMLVYAGSTSHCSGYVAGVSYVYTCYVVACPQSRRMLELARTMGGTVTTSMICDVADVSRRRVCALAHVSGDVSHCRAVSSSRSTGVASDLR